MCKFSNLLRNMQSTYKIDCSLRSESAGASLTFPIGGAYGAPQTGEPARRLISQW